MDLSYTPEEQAFRQRVRAWIAENKPAADRAPELKSCAPGNGA